MPETLISTLFERGAFTGEDSAVAATVLMGYAIGLPAYIAVKVFSTAYWSGQDTLSPVKISVIITAMNIGLSLILIWPFGVAGIAISTGLVGWVQLGLLYRGLKGRKIFDFDARFKSALVKIIFASFVMGSILVVFDNYFDGFGVQGELARILTLCALVLLGLIAYGLCIIASGAVKVNEIRKYLKKEK